MASSPAAEGADKELLSLARELAAMGADADAADAMQAESLRLARKVSLLVHLLEEIRKFAVRNSGKTPSCFSAAGQPSPWSCVSEMAAALAVVKRFMMLPRRDDALGSGVEDLGCKNMEIQYQYVTWQLEKALGNISYEFFRIPGEVQEEVELVRAQLRREYEKAGAVTINIFQEIYSMFSSCAHVKALKRQSPFKLEEVKYEHDSKVDQNLLEMILLVAKVSAKSGYFAEKMVPNLMERLKKTAHVDVDVLQADKKLSGSGRSTAGDNKSDSLVIPEDFQCPISLELMRDPVIVSTGQTYERSFIQRWINCGHRTCPKTQQKLQNLTLTPNFVLRSLIMQWCEVNMIEQPHSSITGRTRSDGASDETIGDRSMINALVSQLTSRSMDEQRSAAAEIRLLAKSNMDNRILLAEAGAIPVLVGLLRVDDKKTQEHAVTSLLNLSLYDHNKQVIVLAGAIIPIIEVLGYGNMEARENAAASIFSLSLIDENKITIGGMPRAIEALIELLQEGSPRGKKDAASALFNLCLYQGNRSRAARAGIIGPLLQLLSNSSTLVDESLTILSLLVSNQEGKDAVTQANIIPILLNFLRTGEDRHKENAAAILLGLCKKDNMNLARVVRMGAVIPLKVVAASGTERAKRKATSLLEHLQKMVQIH